jgi:hypothetical protein
MSHTAPASIKWPCDMAVASQKNETKVREIVHRKGEWGRGRDLPQHRLDEISRACSDNGMTLYQALSLRRSLLRSLPGGMRRVSQSSSMGTSSGQQEVAGLFEKAVESHLKSSLAGEKGVFLTESELLSEMKDGKRARGPTPDIVFLKPVQINGCPVTWLDAKLYYASAMFANNKRIPNGKLRKQAERYNQYYGGKGAFVFGQGFCVDLGRIVTNALLLDATPLDMSEVNAYQDAEKLK